MSVDLRNQKVISHRALGKALGTDDGRPTTVHLRGLNDFVDIFVSIRGRFRAAGRTPATTTLEVPYGELTDGPKVHLACTASVLRRTDVPTGTFPARCLGHVRSYSSSVRKSC